ncbi:OTU domain-containing protein 6B [Porphyridium purpureum]|uniref:OTU domain-containing protein 6B n=1 Tax=Porphyridium purpureum TaxID=35688 RepID=A0A5J4YV83_PORPP|nr:OTU domain-containing protein 6B [Porphyridium purpureum]|eukprot:POR5923..scf229_5
MMAELGEDVDADVRGHDGETLNELEARHAEEGEQLARRAEMMRARVPKKDRVGRARVQEEVDELMRSLRLRHADERKQLGVEAAPATVLPADAARTEQTPLSPQSREPSKAQKRKLKKKAQQEEMERRLEEDKAAARALPNEKQAEADTLCKKLEPLGLTLHAIPPDGNCLFASVADQLVRNASSSSDLDPALLNANSSAASAALRRIVADHMLAHQDDFAPFLDTDVPFQTCCEQIRDEPNCWGGQLEIKALAEALAARIEVFAADLPLVVSEPPQDTPVKRTIRLSYHRKMYGLGEHYNSVVPESASASNKVIASPVRDCFTLGSDGAAHVADRKAALVSMSRFTL